MDNNELLCVRADFRADGTIVPIACVFQDNKVAHIRRIMKLEKRQVNEGQIKWAFLCRMDMKNHQELCELELFQDAWSIKKYEKTDPRK